MIDDLEDEVVLHRARRIGLRRSPFYTYMTWVTVAALASAFTGFMLSGGSSDLDTIPLLLAIVFFAGASVDLLGAWYLARQWGVARLLKERARIAEEAADRNDHHAVLAALDPVKRFWGIAEIFLTARSRIALRKAGEL